MQKKKWQERCLDMSGLTARQVVKELSVEIGNRADQALKRELWLSPKPGLVDRSGPGSHIDMDHSLMAASIDALRPHWGCFFRAGRNWTEARRPLTVAGEALTQVREVGIRTEQAMYKATCGVNTHKGIVFVFGTTLFALGVTAWRFFSTGQWIIGEVLDTVSTICNGIAEHELRRENGSKKTHGQEVFTRYGSTGVRGEAESGWKTVRSVGMPLYQGARNRGLNETDAGLLALLGMMAVVDDSVVLFRGGHRIGDELKLLAGRALCHGLSTDSSLVEESEKLGRYCKDNGVSPGGSADLLSLVYFLDSLPRTNGTNTRI